MEVVVFLIKEGLPLPIFITENQRLNLNHSIFPRTTRFNISQHKPIQPPSQKKPYNHTPRRYVVLWIPFSLHTNRSKNYLLLITRHWKSELLTPLKKQYFKRGYSICGNWRATALQVVHLWSRPSTPTDQIITRADYSYKGAPPRTRYPRMQQSCT